MISEELMTPLNQNNIQRQFADWLRALDCMLEENIMLKHRLSEFIVRNKHSKLELDVLEAYQNSFLNKDAHIILLRQDIILQQKDAAALSSGAELTEALAFKQQKLEYDVMMMCEQFRSLRSGFTRQFTIGIS